MNIKERLHRQLTQARELSETLLRDFRTPEQWLHQVHDQANHAVWFAGHMAHTDNFFISLIAPENARELRDYDDRFGVGSTPTPSPHDYPPVSEVLNAMRERRETLRGLLESMSEKDLAKPTAHGAPEFLRDYASVFEMAIWHEGLHRGQLSVCRRALGHQPLQTRSTPDT